MLKQDKEIGSESQAVADYYDQTGEDYEAWSTEGYLHYGYWRLGVNPFSRKKMLEEMNMVVFKLLGLDQLKSGAVADLGCGVGAVSRFGSRQFPALDFHAVTVSPEQVEAARRHHDNERATYYCRDYHDLPFENGELDRIFFLESLCHSTTPDQALAEAAAKLKPGGRIVLTDGYLQRPLKRTSNLFRKIVETVAHNWAVPMFHEIELAKQWTGEGQLQLVDTFECGWRLGPSAVHAGHLTLVHAIKLAFERDVTPWRWKHLRASALTIALGLSRRNFGYHVLVFERSDT